MAPERDRSKLQMHLIIHSPFDAISGHAPPGPPGEAGII